MYGLDQGFYEQAVVLAVIQRANERAVDFDKIHRQMFQVLEGGKTNAEIVQRQLAAERANAGEQDFGMRHLVEGRRFGDFQDQLMRLDALLFQHGLQLGGQFGVVEAAGGQVDREMQTGLACDQGDGMLQHPLVDLPDQPRGFCRSDQRSGRQNLPIRRPDPQQRLIVHGPSGLDRHNGLEEQRQPVVVQRVGDQRKLRRAIQQAFAGAVSRVVEMPVGTAFGTRLG